MEAIKKDELFDEELCNMVRFNDETSGVAKSESTEKASGKKESFEKKRDFHKFEKKPMDAEWEPVKNWFDEKTINLIKLVLIFIGLEYVVFYWQQTGQMQDSAAVPSMIVCALLAGISVGKNWKWKNF